MATILIVDDEPANRQLLATLLGYAEHRVLEAADGATALAQVHAERPDLVIADVLMPTMDGYELVQRMRSRPDVAATPVVFYTAHYLESEARALAEKCGVRYVITKPSDPEVILQTVEAALGLEASPLLFPDASQFDREHLQLVSDKLSQKVGELEAANDRLSALIDFSQQLASERNPPDLLAGICHRGRELMGASQALIAIYDSGRTRWQYFLCSGLASEVFQALVPLPPHRGMLGTLLNERTSLRFVSSAMPQDTGLPEQYPTVHSLVAARVASPSRTYGWLCLTNKLGTSGFSEEDERHAMTVATLAGRIYENGSLYQEIETRARDLEREIEEKRRAEVALADRTRIALLGSDIGSALTEGGTADLTLQRCAEAVVVHLDVPFARIWTLKRGENVLRLVASAGMYTHTDGPHSRIEVGQKKIGVIAAEGKPVITDRVIGDPRISEQDWARREGITAFAGFPLAVEGEVVGVMAMFARAPFPSFVLAALNAIADEISLGIHRLQTVDELRMLNAELERRVADRTAQLDAANKELEAFSYSVSHDLTAPLRRVDGFSELLREELGETLSDHASAYLDRIQSGAHHMAQLIQDLLGLSRVGRLELLPNEVDLTELAKRIAANLQKEAPERNVEFLIAAGLAARGDARLLRILLENLIGNAWKYTSKRDSARIELAMMERDGVSVYFVRDDGVGFDMAYVDKLFAPFQRLHGESEFEGTGIGLATVHRIIQRHGGRIWGEGAPGHGATFYFTLPAAENDQRDAET